MTRSQLLLLIFILIVGLFFRMYKIVERMDFGHDADLYSWIVKDIAINHHFFGLMGALLGLIWHIHIALAPVLLTVPFAIFLSKKLPKFKE